MEGSDILEDSDKKEVRLRKDPSGDRSSMGKDEEVRVLVMSTPE
jgi:hypothetical protein